MSIVWARVGPGPVVPAAERGTLTIKPRVASRLATRAVQTRTSADSKPSVDVTHFGDDHVELAARVTLPYPDEPIGTVLDRLREQVAREVAAAVGRPVRSIDLTVEKFSDVPTTSRRQVQ